MFTIRERGNKYVIKKELISQGIHYLNMRI